MGWERPLLGASMWAFMLGFAGLPPTGGFLGKFYVFSAAYDRGWLWLVIVGIAATAVSLYYYLAVIRALYLRPSAELQFAAGGQPPRDLLLNLGVLACFVVTVGSFFAAAAADRPRREGGPDAVAPAPQAGITGSRAAAAELLPAPGRDARA